MQALEEVVEEVWVEELPVDVGCVILAVVIVVDVEELVDDKCVVDDEELVVEEDSMVDEVVVVKEELVVDEAVVVDEKLDDVL